VKALPSYCKFVVVTMLLFVCKPKGVLVGGSEPGKRIMDDGSGVIELHISKEFQDPEMKKGFYEFTSKSNPVFPNAFFTSLSVSIIHIVVDSGVEIDISISISISISHGNSNSIDINLSC
jgi:hypothetical protein